MKKLILGGFVLLLFSCGQRESKQTSTPNYFDIAGYFAAEATRLQKANPTVEKQVFAKGEIEKKPTKIADWKIELAGFNNADINKASWRGEFATTSDGNTIIYTTANPKIPIKKVDIIKINDQVKGIKIIKSTQNSLYTSTDTLFYFPDSLYTVQSEQKIKLLSKKKYLVIGKFK